MIVKLTKKKLNEVKSGADVGFPADPKDECKKACWTCSTKLEQLGNIVNEDYVN